MSGPLIPQYADPKGAIVHDFAGNILIAAGTAKPTDATLGYAVGCLFFDVDAAAGAQVYINEGTATSCDFNALPSTATLTTLDLSTLAATAAELNRVAQASTRIVSTTAATLAITAAAHGERIVVLNSTHTQTLTLPQATGTGNKYSFMVGTLGTDGAKIIKVANATDILQGASHIAQTDTTQVNGFITTATDDTVTLNKDTTGGIVGDWVEITDVVTGTFLVQVYGGASGTVATPFSATVSS